MDVSSSILETKMQSKFLNGQVPGKYMVFDLEEQKYPRLDANKIPARKKKQLRPPGLPCLGLRCYRLSWQCFALRHQLKKELFSGRLKSKVYLWKFILLREQK